MNTKLKIILAFVAVGLILMWIFKGHLTKPASSQPSKTSSASQNDVPAIVSTDPDLSSETIVGANQVISITFNRSLQNKGEFKLKMSPDVPVNVELSQDRKTAKITPLKPYYLGSEYTIDIGTDTKFDGVGAWGKEVIYHFKTVTYNGV